MKKPIVKTFGDFGKCVKLSSVDDSIKQGLLEFMNGQTIPHVSSDKDPTDWIYICDYERYIGSIIVCAKCNKPVDEIYKEPINRKIEVRCHGEKEIFNFDERSYRSMREALKVLSLTRAFEVEH